MKDSFINPDDYKSLWPEKWSVERLLVRRNEIGPIAFGKKYLSKTLDEVGRTFDEKDINDALDYTQIIHSGRDDLKKDEIEIMTGGLDLAGGKSPQAKWTVLFMLGIDKIGMHNLLDIFRDKIDYPTIKSTTLDVYLKWLPSAIRVENNSLQVWLLEDMASGEDKGGRYAEIPLEAHRTGTNKSSVEEGIPMLATLLRNHRVRIPYGDMYTRQTVEPFLTELRTHPLGATTDILMAWWFSEISARQSNFQHLEGIPHFNLVKRRKKDKEKTTPLKQSQYSNHYGKLGSSVNIRRPI